jgi:hypothetical protein
MIYKKENKKTPFLLNSEQLNIKAFKDFIKIT